MYISKFVYIDRYIDRYIHECGAHMYTDMHGLTVNISWYDIRPSPVASHKLIVGSHLQWIAYIMIITNVQHMLESTLRSSLGSRDSVYCCLQGKVFSKWWMSSCPIWCTYSYVDNSCMSELNTPLYIIPHSRLFLALKLLPCNHSTSCPVDFLHAA